MPSVMATSTDWRELLAADVQMVGDGGGKAPALPRSVIGADNVARVLASILPVLPDRRASGATRGEPPAGCDPSRSGRQDGQHGDARRARRADPTIRAVANPDKLRHVGPVADAWAIAREVKQARRLRD
jgi:RNA polymerase sigma-70 factor (ECF subfamily)